MVCKITTKNFKLSHDLDKLLKQLVSKIDHQLPNLVSDLPLVDLIIKKNPRKGNFFEGKLMLSLPKKNLIAHFEGASLGLSLHEGFDKLLKELKKYKGMHYSSDSTYFDHGSIRK